METNANPLTMDLTTMDTSLPVLAADKYILRIHKAELSKTNDGQTPVLKLELKTVNPGKSAKGDAVGAGLTVFDTIMLAPRGKSDWNMVNRSVAELVQSAKLTGAIRMDNVQEWHKQLEGRQVTAMVEFVPEGPDPKNPGRTFRAKNQIGYYLK